MKLSRSTIFLAILTISLFSCKKFLDVKPSGVIVAETVAEFEGILNASQVTNPFGLNALPLIATDDVTDKSLQPQQTSVKANTYFWKEYINSSADARPEVWNEMYNSIANLNVIVEGVLDAKDGSMAKKKSLYAEALVSRSFCYFHLLSMFAPAYTEAGAETDYGLPYVTSTDQSLKAPERGTLKESYEHMITDIKAAIPDLPETNVNNSRVTKNVANGMLSRVYMSMGKYDEALEYANEVITSGAAIILDYNDFVGDDLPNTNGSPEELWVRYAFNVRYFYSSNLLSKYNLMEDLRIDFFASVDANGVYSYGGSSSYAPNRGITYAELYLNKTEAMARAGKFEDALDIVNDEIRMKRFSPDDYTPLTATTKEEAINKILEERRRELAFKGLRWSDMKRLNAEGRMPEVKRFGADGITVLGTLLPGSVNYTYQIPLAVQSFNEGMPLNKR